LRFSSDGRGGPLVYHLASDDIDEIGQLMKKLKPDAIACANDRTAGHLMHGLLSLGYQISEDVRIVGIDDVQYTKLLPVPLTTVHQPCRRKEWQRHQQCWTEWTSRTCRLETSS
jgi:hypothetical protein